MGTGFVLDVADGIIVLTVRNDTQTRNHAMRNGANAFVSKPFMMDELYECIRDVF